MAHVAPIYPNFARGEVSPLMFGRIDIEQYPTCLDKCRNCYIRPYGCATRLTGTEFVANTKNSGKVRLLKFVFSPTDSYIIECGAGYFRFYQNGAPVYKNGEVYEITNDYYEDQLDSIQYVQLDDIIKLTCLPHNNDNSTAKPKELIRNASDDWTFRNVTFVETPYLDQNTTSITMKPSAQTGNSITIEASSAFFNSNMVGANMWIGTKVKDDTTNKDVQGYVKITAYTDSTHVIASVQSKLSGTSATKLWGEGAFSDYRGYPAVIALFDGRLYYARTPYQPRNVYGSKPYAYETFTPAVDNEDDAGINIALATNANGDGSDIRWMIGASYLLCGTYGGEFVIRSAGDGAITPTDISARQRTNWGGERVQPLVAGTFIHFLQRNGNKLRQFQYDYYYDAYKAVDVSIFSEHLLESPIKEMCLQKNPDSIIYLMREDGKVVMLTLEQDQSVQAWSLLEELGAKVESIQTIPSFYGNYDEVYMVMNRQILHTTLGYTCSNPNLTITNNYTDTKPVPGTEIIDLTYKASNDIWVSSDSTELNTKLRVHCSNGNVEANTTYSLTKSETGTITEVLECTNNLYYYINKEVMDYYEQAPELNRQTGVASGFSRYAFYNLSANTETGFRVEFTTSSGGKGAEAILDFKETNGKKGRIDHDNLFLKVIANGEVYYGPRMLENETYQIYTDEDGRTIKISSTSQTVIITTLPNQCILTHLGNATGLINKPFRGTINLSISSIGMSTDRKYLAKNYGVWTSQTTSQVVDLESPNYEISLSDTPDINDTLTCVWSTITGYTDPETLGIEITGTPENNDTIELTYTTALTGAARYIERMQDPITPDNKRDWWYVRSGLKYDGYQRTEGISLALSANSGTVPATASDDIFLNNMVGNRIRLRDENYNIYGEGTITEVTDETHATLEITDYFQSQTIAGGMWGISTDAVSNLDHLNGREVQVYADSKQQANKTVTYGSINIDDAFVVVVGLPYQSYITTMPMEAGSQNGTAVGKRKRISEMAIRVWNSLGVKVGRDLNNLYDTIYQQQEPYTGVIPNIKYNQGWVWDANITVEQSHPYPMNILSIAPIVTEVDK